MLNMETSSSGIKVVRRNVTLSDGSSVSARPLVSSLIPV